MRIAISVCLSFLFIGGCGNNGNDDEIVARVGNAVMKRDEMMRRMAWEGTPALREYEFLDRWKNRELVYQEAKRLKLDKSEDLRWELELVEREYLVQKLLERHFAENIEITDEEIETFYERNKDVFQVDIEEVRALHILTKTRERANLALQEIRAGKAFEKVAEEYSVGIFREQQGDMGFFRREDVIPEIARQAFNLAEGRVSQVIQSGHGFHIIKVIKKRAQGDYKELPEVRNEIIQQLMINEERNAYFDLIVRLQDKTNVYIRTPQDGVGTDTLSTEQDL